MRVTAAIDEPHASDRRGKLGGALWCADGLEDPLRFAQLAREPAGALNGGGGPLEEESQWPPTPPFGP
jgi:hypothetical protein